MLSELLCFIQECAQMFLEHLQELLHLERAGNSFRELF